MVHKSGWRACRRRSSHVAAAAEGSTATAGTPPPPTYNQSTIRNSNCFCVWSSRAPQLAQSRAGLTLGNLFRLVDLNAALKAALGARAHAPPSLRRCSPCPYQAPSATQAPPPALAARAYCLTVWLIVPLALNVAMRTLQSCTTARMPTGFALQALRRSRMNRPA